MSKISKEEVYFYFRSMALRKEGKNFCQRCGILIGPKYQNKKSYDWEGFNLCPGCYEDKVFGDKNSYVDLEDLGDYAEKIKNKKK